ncbi:Crp/Fnr family transcriptional regulator [Fusobacterium sp.]|uniref:Crp/Fnr family transcriptional regulator n=1 Tax=Fusobacterium sp. TaxID=68766 RepID=UPI0026244859|nr:Crp/Fnr family transcriptional regulator [Fusobacterium sp.]
MDIIKKLEKTKLFKNIDVKIIEKILENINYTILKYEKGETVVFRGDEVEGLYIALSGELFSEMAGEKGEIKKIEDILEGSIIASAFIFGNNSKFPVDLISRTESEIFFIEKHEFLKMLQKDENLIKNILDEISNKAQFLSAKIWHGVNNKTIGKKLADYILKNMEDGEIKFKPSLNEVANLFNIARPSLSRVIISFIDEGILERDGRKYKIKNLEKLKNI